MIEKINSRLETFNHTKPINSLAKGDILAFDPEKKCIVFFSPEEGHFGIITMDQKDVNKPEHFYPAFFEMDKSVFIRIMELVCAITGMSAEINHDYLKFELSFRLTR